MAFSTFLLGLFFWNSFYNIFFAFTLGSFGDNGRGFLEDFYKADIANLRSAFIGGIIFNFANLLLVIAIEIAGMAIAFPIGIGIALVLGVFTNYISQPEGNPYVLMVLLIIKHLKTLKIIHLKVYSYRL